MFEYLIGKIIYKNEKYIILESNFKGYKIFINDSSKINLNEINKIFLFYKISQNNKGYFLCEYYGFKTVVEKIFFENLLTVNGVGPKIALQIMKNDLNILKSFIANKNINGLIELENINYRLASVLCNQLSYKFSSSKFLDIELNENPRKNLNYVEEISAALKSLGYKKNDISFAINSLDKELNNVNDAISEAIKIIVNKNESITVEA